MENYKIDLIASCDGLTDCPIGYDIKLISDKNGDPVIEYETGQDEQGSFSEFIKKFDESKFPRMQLAEHLVLTANKLGSGDNITCSSMSIDGKDLEKVIPDMFVVIADGHGLSGEKVAQSFVLLAKDKINEMSYIAEWNLTKDQYLNSENIEVLEEGILLVNSIRLSILKTLCSCNKTIKYDKWEDNINGLVQKLNIQDEISKDYLQSNNRNHFYSAKNSLTKREKKDLRKLNEYTKVIEGLTKKLEAEKSKNPRSKFEIKKQ